MQIRAIMPNILSFWKRVSKKTITYFTDYVNVQLYFQITLQDEESDLNKTLKSNESESVCDLFIKTQAVIKAVRRKFAEYDAHENNHKQ